jgi:sarcosine oxidase, subunit gamma
MADTLIAAHPLEAWRAALSPAVELAALASAVDLRLGSDDPDGLLDVVGGVPPRIPNTWTELRDGGRAYWLGPDEWLLTGSRPGSGWERELRAVVGPSGGAAVDVSDQRTELWLRGAAARELLASGCALDLRPSSFPHGSCAQTLLGQVGVLLAADDDDVRVLVRTSYAGHLAGWLLDAAVELPTGTPSDQQGDGA